MTAAPAPSQPTQVPYAGPPPKALRQPTKAPPLEEPDQEPAGKLRPVMDVLEEHLWPWQWEYMTCGSRWVIVNKSRNTGYTDVGLVHAVMHCVAHPGHRFFVTTTKVEKAEEELIDPIANRILPALRKTDIRPRLMGQGMREMSGKIEFPNGAQIKAAANEVEHLRGPTRASYLFDEAATWAIRQHENLREAVYPIVRSEGMNPHGTLRMISTPKPTRNLYRKVWEGKTS